ncbi:hypothetical protein SteCoe_35899 [Stentor coeruleus]|uniref:Uncharacterized protein n=1 Tax=Stentor coeruleus TaxID=5963 RepID=A0A1R2ARD3_9CILI|nr:hypothetical protein SteCoe_35899 [Stentor coeruleus]
MRKILRYHDWNINTLSDESMNSLDKFRIKYITPFKPRAPTPPKSKELSTKEVSQQIPWKLRQSSVNSADIIVLKVPFSSVTYINKMRQIQTFSMNMHKKQLKVRKNNRYKKHRRSESLKLVEYN